MPGAFNVNANGVNAEYSFKMLNFSSPGFGVQASGSVSGVLGIVVLLGDTQFSSSNKQFYAAFEHCKHLTSTHLTSN